MPSRWVKLRPWYYTERRQPTRAVETAEALRYEEAACVVRYDDHEAAGPRKEEVRACY